MNEPNYSNATLSPTVMDITFGNLQAALLFNGLLAIGLLLGFLIARARFPATYASRVFAVPLALQPRPLGFGVFSAIPKVLVSDKELLDKCGVDAFAAIFHTRVMAVLFAAIGIPAALVLIPINATGGNGLQGISLLTLGNVRDEQKLWAHFLFTLYAITLTLYAIFRIITESVRLRVSCRTHSLFANRVMMVRDVPPEWRSEVEITEIFNRACEGCVEEVIIPKVIPSAHAKVSKEHLAARNKLEAAVSAFFSRISRHSKHGTPADSEGDTNKPNETIADEAMTKLRPKHRLRIITGKKVDSITEYSKAMRDAQRELSLLHSVENLEPMSTAFVVLHEPFQTHLVSRSIVHNTPWVMGQKFPSVSADDVIWANANTAYFHREWRFLATKIITFAMIIFWGVITAATLAFTDLANLGKSIPAIQTFLNEYPQISKLIGGVLPPVVIAILISFVAPILRLLSVFGGSPLRTYTEQEVFSQFFSFQLINVFAVNVIGSSFLASFNAIKDNPSSILDILAISIPQSANFFIQYLLVRGLLAPSLEIVQAARLITGPIILFFFGKSPRSVLKSHQPPAFSYAESMAAHGLTVTIGLVFCVLSPVVLVFVVLYFSLYTLVYFYQMQYVYLAAKSTGGGKFLYTAANHMFVGLFIMEFMILAIFLLSKNYIISGLLVLVVAVTIWSYSQARKFQTIIDTIPVSSVAGKSTLYSGGILFSDKMTRWMKYLVPSRPEEEEGTLAYLRADELTAVNATATSSEADIVIVHVDVDEDKTLEKLTVKKVSASSLYMDPSMGDVGLKVWIPKCGVGNVYREVVDDIVGDAAAISKSQIVSVGAGVNAKGNLVLSNGKYAEMYAL
ncbi:hypothetical protein BJ741DRAFT_380081 [Chytriomyces cf. hyalinus JEL632]|nr:hypothetical protein BJ741DRAFT_380081 [Chytriomyces cf. hyalinus JEL632]